MTVAEEAAVEADLVVDPEVKLLGVKLKVKIPVKIYQNNVVGTEIVIAIVSETGRISRDNHHPISNRVAHQGIALPGGRLVKYRYGGVDRTI